MNLSPHREARSIDPHALGPLDDRSHPGAPNDPWFSGVERFLSRPEIDRRKRLWGVVSQRIESLCAPGERVLYVAPAAQKIGLVQYFALGALVMRYHQTALVLTDRRIFEVLLEFDGKSPAGRVRSYGWDRVERVKLSFGKLVLKPVGGKAVGWHVQRRGDRKLLKLLLPKLDTELVGRASDTTGRWPIEHCASCGEGLPEKPSGCSACGTPLRSKGLAAALSLAFPGAGLYYAGHPVLGTLDLLGEILIFFVFASMLLVAGSPPEIAAAVLAGFVLVGLTKLESVHVGHVLISRNRTETLERRNRFKKGAYVGGAVSVLALLALAPFAGALAERIDHDLDFPTETAWSGSRNVPEGEAFYEDPDLRSQWRHEDGWVASVFAYPLVGGETADSFRREFAAQEDRLGANVLLNDESLPQGLHGFRFIERFVDEDEAPVVVMHYFVHDEEGSDIHQVLMAVTPDAVPEAESAMRGLLARAEWIEARPPVY